MRRGGFNGFSFREIAADVGVKSSSVHYHFPTKDTLAAAVVRRYTDQVSEFIDGESVIDSDPVSVWVKAFRGTLHSADRMCPSTVLAAASQDLPPEVAAEVRRYFKMCLDKLIAKGLAPAQAAKLLSTITGALVLSNGLDDLDVYDRATSEFKKTKK